LCPVCPPGFLPLFVRRLLGLGFSRRSVDGGVELLLLFFLWLLVLL
jgi:hypothetical protein